MLRHRIRSVVVALVLVLAVSPPVRAEETPEIDPEQVGAVLLEMLNTLEEDDTEGCREAIGRLTEIEPERRMGLLHAYATVAGDSIHPFRREILDIVLDRLGASALRALLNEAVTADATLLERTLALRLVREREVPGAMEIVLTAGMNEDPKNLGRPFVQRSLRESVAVVLEKQPSSAAVLQRRFPELPAQVQDVALDVLEKRVQSFGTREMSQFLGSDSRLNRSVLPRLVRLPIVDAQPLADGAATHILWSLQDADPVVRRSAALVVARFHLATLIDELMKLMEDPDSSVASAAHRALLQISGARLISRKELWATWLEGEREWAKSRMEGVLAAANSDDTETAQSGLQQLARHRLLGDDITPRLSSACLHHAAIVRQQACETLGILGSPLSLPQLALRLEDEAPAVVSAASEALQRVTSVPAPESTADWPSLLRLDR